jgi:cell division protein FtsB
MKRRSETGLLYSVLQKKWFWWTIALLMLYSFFAGDTGFYTQYRLWREGKQLQRRIAFEEQRREWLRNEVESLTDDLARIELEARLDGMGKKDEIIFLME